METKNWPKRGTREWKNEMRCVSADLHSEFVMLRLMGHCTLRLSHRVCLCIARHHSLETLRLSAQFVSLCVTAIFLLANVVSHRLETFCVVWCCPRIWPNIFVQFWERVASAFLRFSLTTSCLSIQNACVTVCVQQVRVWSGHITYNDIAMFVRTWVSGQLVGQLVVVRKRGSLLHVARTCQTICRWRGRLENGSCASENVVQLHSWFLAVAV